MVRKIWHASKSVTNGITDGCNPKPIYPSNFFEVGRHKKSIKCIIRKCIRKKEKMQTGHIILKVFYLSCDSFLLFAVMIKYFGQTGLGRVDPVQTNMGLHCLSFNLHLSDALFYGKNTLFKF